MTPGGTVPSKLALRFGIAALAAAGLLAAVTPARGAAPATPAADPPLPAGATAYVDVSVATLWVSPGQARPLDAPAGSNPADPRAWVAGMGLADRVWLVGKLETQALYGQAVTVLETSGDWVHVVVHGQPTPRDPRGYPGWLPAVQLTTDGAFRRLQDRPFALVESPTTWLYGDVARHRRISELSLDTRLPVLARTAGSVLVATPEGGHGWLAAKDTHVYRAAADIPRPTGADLVATAKLFAGLHYLWAGTSAFGFDCSGFTHTVYDLHGVTIPRDADAQFAAGTPVAADQLQPGDLLFYAYNHGTGFVHHVGMYVGDGYEIDAPANSATVESPIEIVKVAEHRYADQYAGARRFL
jgi:gamma-D-glutamyl-L-lysine dipeptidyl-peptidase